MYCDDVGCVCVCVRAGEGKRYLSVDYHTVSSVVQSRLACRGDAVIVVVGVVFVDDELYDITFVGIVIR